MAESTERFVSVTPAVCPWAFGSRAKLWASHDCQSVDQTRWGAHLEHEGSVKLASSPSSAVVS